MSLAQEIALARVYDVEKYEDEREYLILLQGFS